MKPSFLQQLRILSLTAVVMLTSSPAYAGGGTYASQSVNFLLLVALLVVVFQMKVAPLFPNRAKEIQQNLEKGQKERDIARAHLEEVEAEYAKLEAHIVEIHDQAVADITSMKEHFKDLMHEEVKHIEVSTQRAIQDEINRVKKELQVESAEIALKLAENLVKQNISSEDHVRFKQSFIHAVEKEGING